MIVVGRVGAAFGVKGEVHVHSLTDPPDNLVEYSPWYLSSGDDWVERTPATVRGHGRGLVAKFQGVADRDDAVSLVGRDIAVRRDQLAETGEDEHYWVDLLGMTVVTTTGMELGKVEQLMETGANDVLVVQGDRERLIPYLPGDVVKAVRHESACIEVDWDPDF